VVNQGINKQKRCSHYYTQQSGNQGIFIVLKKNKIHRDPNQRCVNDFMLFDWLVYGLFG